MLQNSFQYISERDSFVFIQLMNQYSPQQIDRYLFSSQCQQKLQAFQEVEIMTFKKPRIKQKPQKKGFRKQHLENNVLSKLYVQDQLQDVVQSSLLTPETKPSDIQISEYNDEPEWLSEYHKCERVLFEVDQLTQEIIREQGKKMMAINQKKHDQIIEKKMQEATQKVLDCQKTLKTIEKKSKEQQQTQHSNKVLSNMIISLAMNVKDKAKRLRNVQQNQLKRNKQLAQYTRNTELENVPTRNSNLDGLQGQAWLSEQNFQVLQQRMMNQRNEQIMKIVKSVHTLNAIYKQLQELVIHQGSLLDRIDQNIQSTVQHVKKANQHLAKAQEHQKSNFGKKVMCVLAALIAICLLILIIKYT